jgi:hypothetical protein
VITGLTAAIAAGRVSRSQNKKRTAPGLCDVNDGPYPVPLARQVSHRVVAAPAYRVRSLLAGRPVIRFIMGGRR